MMFSFAWRWSSLTQALALSREDYRIGKAIVSVVTGFREIPMGWKGVAR